MWMTNKVIQTSNSGHPFKLEKLNVDSIQICVCVCVFVCVWVSMCFCVCYTLLTLSMSAILEYAVKIGNASDDTITHVDVIDKEGKVVASGSNQSGTIEVKDAHLWWPYTMNSTSSGYLYTFKVSYSYQSLIYSVTCS